MMPPTHVLLKAFVMPSKTPQASEFAPVKEFWRKPASLVRDLNCASPLVMGMRF